MKVRTALAIVFYTQGMYRNPSTPRQWMRDRTLEPRLYR